MADDLTSAGDDAQRAIPDLSGPALEIARREAVVEAGDPDAVGDLIDAYSEGENAVTARFSASVEGYRGWQWSVTVAMVDPERPTVSEVMLLPGSEALLAPAWVPWKERVRGGDLGVGDLLPPAPDDARIVPAYVQSDDPAVEELSWEIGLGRVRVLSREGRLDAATRWHTGDFGPEDEMARHAPGTCATCAFYLPLAGSLGAGFGACSNEYSPADGHVVDSAYGCGAHSEVSVDRFSASAAADTVIDELQLDVYQRSEGDDAAVDDGASRDLTDQVLADVRALEPDAVDLEAVVDVAAEIMGDDVAADDDAADDVMAAGTADDGVAVDDAGSGVPAPDGSLFDGTLFGRTAEGES